MKKGKTFLWKRTRGAGLDELCCEQMDALLKTPEQNESIS
jgi:hypothetical protein